MLDMKILLWMFKEEFRLQASFFNRSYFLASSLVLMVFTFIMGISLPLVRRAVALEDIILATHWVMVCYGLCVGGFALFGDRILERRFGSVSLIVGSGYTLPIRHRRLFFLFSVKDVLYYIFFTILPMIMGLVLASVFVLISLSTLSVLFISLTLSFVLGISFSVMLFMLQLRWGVLPILAAGMIFFQVPGKMTVQGISTRLPSLVFFHSHSISLLLEILALVLLFAVLSLVLIKERPMPRERTVSETYRRTARFMQQCAPEYGPVLAKDMMDLVRSRMIVPVLFTFILPLLFLYAITWFIESVMLMNLRFSLLFYGVMVGFFSTLLYSWLSNIDISECYNSMPLSMPQVIRTKLILYFFLDIMVAVPYLILLGYLKGESHLLWVSLLIMVPVSMYTGSVAAFLTGLFTNSYLLDARILIQFAFWIVPVLIAETLLSFCYPFENNMTIWYIAGLGLLLIATSLIFIQRLNSRWMGRMFRIA